jgi:hypothetical protein
MRPCPSPGQQGGAASVRRAQSEVRRVSWSPEADVDLQLAVSDSAVRNQLKHSTEATSG